MDGGEHTYLMVIILVEVALVLLLVFLVYLLKLIYLYKRRRDKAIFFELLTFLKTCRSSGTKMPHIKNTKLLLAAFQHIDKYNDNTEHWDTLKSQLMAKQILPRLTKKTHPITWQHKHFLTECFQYYIDESYEKILIKLIRDNSVLIKSAAISVAPLSTKLAVVEALNQLKILQHQQEITLTSQIKKSKLLFDALAETLQTKNDLYLRKACYDVLNSVGPPKEFHSLASQDIQSNYTDLRIASIKTFALSNPGKAIYTLTTMLSDSNWLIRNTTVKCLGKIANPKTITEVANALNDPIWWVRVNAAKALAAYGLDGKKALREFQQSHQHHEAKYFLEIYNLHTVKT